jgi:hypothetical protein
MCMCFSKLQYAIKHNKLTISHWRTVLERRENFGKEGVVD